MTAPVHAFLAAAALCAAHALQTAWAATPAPHCESLPPTLARTLQPGALLLLGELHGSVQSPAMAERFVCTALRRQRSVALFLEIPADEQLRIDAFLHSDGGPAAQRALVRGSPFWGVPARWQDGRGSTAILGMIDAARRWQQAGAPLDLIAFDSTQNFAERARDPARVPITYTGNFHNMLELPPDATTGDAAPMATHLTDLRPVSLALRSVAGGAAWNCRSACGVHPLAPIPPPLHRELGEALQRSFTDVVPLGPITPSIPAVWRLDARAAM